MTTQIFTMLRMLSNFGSQDLRFCGRPWLHIRGGLVDVKNRQRMGKDLREACVTLFCNGDVEERFTKWQ